MSQSDLFGTTAKRGGFSESAIMALDDTDLLAAFKLAGDCVAKRFLLRKPVLSTWNTVLDYLRSQIAFEPKEQFRILFLDKRDRLIADEIQQTGTVDHVPVYPREVLARALAVNATAIILCHNHPTGDPTPSRADIDMTQAIIDAGKMLGIAVHDHVIIGRDSHASLKGLKLI